MKYRRKKKIIISLLLCSFICVCCILSIYANYAYALTNFTDIKVHLQNFSVSQVNISRMMRIDLYANQTTPRYSNGKTHKIRIQPQIINPKRNARTAKNRVNEKRYGNETLSKLNDEIEVFGNVITNGCALNMKGNIRPFSVKAQLIVMKWVRDSIPFAWIRWGDGDTFQLNSNKRLRDTVKLWETHGPKRLFVSIGMWWMCNTYLKQIWNNNVAVPSLGINTTASLVDHFYLTQGDPANSFVYELRQQGIKGWIIEAQYKVICLVGPQFTRTFHTFLYNKEYIEVSSSNVDVNDIMHKMRQVGYKYKPVPILFAIIAGTSSKIIITESFLSEWGANHSYIDVGSAMDGYAGVASKDFINIYEYCNKEAKFIPDESDHHDRTWMKNGICNQLTN